MFRVLQADIIFSRCDLSLSGSRRMKATPAGGFKRIASLPDLIGKIESALARVLKSEIDAKSLEQMNRILVSLISCTCQRKNQHFRQERNWTDL